MKKELTTLLLALFGLCVLGALAWLPFNHNDNLADATQVSSDSIDEMSGLTISDDNVAATLEALEVPPTCIGVGKSDSGKSVWYKLTVNETISISLDTFFNTNFDANLSVWVGTDHPMSQVACDDKPGDAGGEVVDFEAMTGDMFFIRVSGSVPSRPAGKQLLVDEGFFDLLFFKFAPPIPVELTSFTAQVDGGDVILAWATASETNNAGYEVQQRMAEGHFKALDFVEGQGTTTEPQTYTYRVEDLTPGLHAFRLKQIDFDGAFEITEVVEIAVEAPEGFFLSPAYPNPFNPVTRFTLTLNQAQRVRLEVVDIAGRRAALLHEGTLAAAEAHLFQLDAAHLPSGLYIIRAEGETFTATRNVMLVK